MSIPTAKRCLTSPVRYSDTSAELWLWSGAPLLWRERVTLQFEETQFVNLEPATTLKHWDVLAYWTHQIARGHVVPPLVVSRTETGQMYVHDGNHRLEAMRICFRNRLSRLRVRVAVLQPRRGYEFAYRWFGSYGTYVLVPTPEPMTANSVERSSVETTALACLPFRNVVAEAVTHV